MSAPASPASSPLSSVDDDLDPGDRQAHQRAPRPRCRRWRTPPARSGCAAAAARRARRAASAIQHRVAEARAAVPCPRSRKAESRAPGRSCAPSSVMASSRPRAPSRLARVTMNGASRCRAIEQPVEQLRSRRRPRSGSSSAAQRTRTAMAQAASTPPSAKTEPTERSMPPPMITKVMPSATMARNDALDRDVAQRCRRLPNDGKVSWRDDQRSRSARRAPLALDQRGDPLGAGRCPRRDRRSGAGDRRGHRGCVIGCSAPGRRRRRPG